MREPDVVQTAIGEGFTLQLAGISRGRTGTLRADGAIVNGATRHVEEVILNHPEECAAWAERASARTGLPAGSLETSLLSIYPDAVAMLQTSGPSETGKAARMLELVKSWNYFHDGPTAYVAIPIETGGAETMPLTGKAFRRRLSGLFYAETGDVLSSETLGAAILALDARAFDNGKECPVFIRVAGDLDTVWLDLGDAERWVVRIDQHGWTVTTDCPHAFYRPTGMQPVPTPATGGDLSRLREFVNVGTEQDWRLLIAWLLSTLHPHGPYPVLILQGEQGSAKTTAARIIRSLIDPIAGAVRAAPRKEEDLVIAATRCRVLALDNLSGVKPWLSDGLCRLATYGALTKRELYSDADEVVLTARCSVILTGIDAIATRGDLQDRSFVLDLPAIPEAARRPEAELWTAFEVARPALLGSLLDAVSMALRNHATTPATGYPRMADAARWVVAAEPALPWYGGGFLDAYAGNRADAVLSTLDAAPIWPTLMALLRDVGRWEDTAGRLLAALEARVDEATRRRDGWPGSPAVLTNQLKRLAPSLRQAGIECDQLKRTNAGTPWRLVPMQNVDTVDTVDTVDVMMPLPGDDMPTPIITTSSPSIRPHHANGDDSAASDDDLQLSQKTQDDADLVEYDAWLGRQA